MVAISDFSFDNPRFRILLDRAKDTPPEVLETVTEILSEVRARGDEALFEYMERFDGQALSHETVLVTEDEFEQARDTEYEVDDPSDREALQIAKSWHRHPALRPYLTYNGINLGELIEYHTIEELMPVLARARDAEVRRLNQRDEGDEPSS